MKPFIITLLLILNTGCMHSQKDTGSSALPASYVGIIRSVNRPEHYFIFETEVLFPTGSQLTILRNGRAVGKAEALHRKSKKFQAANILEGAPLTGDLCEPRNR
jgi:hypothetical protein